MQGGAFFFVVIAFFFILWAATGGPSRPISFAGPYITPITNVNQTQVGYGTSTSLAKFGGEVLSAGTSRGILQANLSNDQTQLNTLQQQQETDASFGTASPYKGVVYLGGYVNGTSGTNPNQEYISLRVDSNTSKTVDVTGWKIESTVTGNNATIGSGVRTVHQGAGNVQGDIVLDSGDTVDVTTGVSPIGISFRENECMGYFDQVATFTPGLTSYCPSNTDDFNAHYNGNPLNDDSCYAFIQNTNRCTVPSSIPIGLTSACKAFVAQYLNYNGCVAAHSGDGSFIGSTWHVYLNHGARLWKNSRDNIKLLDAAGKTVDMFTY